MSMAHPSYSGIIYERSGHCKVMNSVLRTSLASVFFSVCSREKTPTGYNLQIGALLARGNGYNPARVVFFGAPGGGIEISPVVVVSDYF